MDERGARRANTRAGAVVAAGVAALAVALVAASKDADGLSLAAAACAAVCTAWLAWDGWRRHWQERAARVAGGAADAPRPGAGRRR
ncbi:hypothetical protein ACIQVO_36220 [Streptomyces sp. NPDC101062]|uniref:hypothetical protein n=1 Tax=unclassified Streptomyces TaxID=2593676 RepID=UPI003822E39E